jgi:exonuclease-1
LHGLVDGIITEDSDLLIFGCKAVLFKLDASGNCVQILRDDFASCREHDFSGWGAAQMRGMAVLSGCDYLKGIKGIGLNKAHKLMRKYKTVERVSLMRSPMTCC